MVRNCLFAWLILSAASAGASEIGSLAAVNRDVTGTRPAEPPRTLSINERLIQNERITTSELSGGQVLFLDQTTLTLTPKSDIILDKYVYDPDKDSGSLSVTMLKGAMRMVGGRITKKSAATIRTPSATIGIRGGMGNIKVNDDGSTEYMHIAGFTATVTTPDGQTVTVSREGGVVTTPAPAGGAEAFTAAATAGRDGQVSAAAGGDAASGDQPAQNPAGVETASSDGGSEGTESAAGGAAATAGGDGAAGANGVGAGSGDVAASGGGAAGSGGGPTYQGVASTEDVAATMSVTAGEGNGGSSTASQPGSTTDGSIAVSENLSGKDGVTTAPPVSTSGEKQTLDYNPPPIELRDPPQEEFAEDNAAAVLAQEVTQILDAVSFDGTWAAVAAVRDGGFVDGGDGLTFQMEYSLTSREGVVTVELPDTGEFAEPNLTLGDGRAIRGDRLLVLGDADRNLSSDATKRTFVGGVATGTALAIDVDDVVNGSIFVDYTDAGVSTLDFVDGVVATTQGRRVVEPVVRDRIAEFRRIAADR